MGLFGGFSTLPGNANLLADILLLNGLVLILSLLFSPHVIRHWNYLPKE